MNNSYIVNGGNLRKYRFRQRFRLMHLVNPFAECSDTCHFQISILSFFKIYIPTSIIRSYICIIFVTAVLSSSRPTQKYQATLQLHCCICSIRNFQGNIWYYCNGVPWNFAKQVFFDNCTVNALVKGWKIMLTISISYESWNQLRTCVLINWGSMCCCVWGTPHILAV